MLHRIVPITAASVLVLATACARQMDTPATTTVTSTTSNKPAPSDGQAAALRLADEMCSREAACNHISNGARYRSEEACLADQGARGTIQVSEWKCTPTPGQSSFEQCLAEIRSEHCEMTLTRFDALEACRSQAVCGR